MTSITTKRHPVKFYTNLIFGCFALLSAGVFLIYIGLVGDLVEELKINQVFHLIFGGSLCVLAFRLVYAYYRNTPTITVYQKTMRIGKHSFQLDTIKQVSLSGKSPFYFVGSFPMEATIIAFKDGGEQIIFDDLYTNSHEVKVFLEQVVIQNREFKPPATVRVSKGLGLPELVEVFKGNQLTSFRGISLWGLLAIFFYLLVQDFTQLETKASLFLVLFSSLWLFIHAWFMHFFELTKAFLIVRNHIFRTRRYVFNLSAIREIVFETQGRLPNCLRIITKDFKSRSYPAGTLKTKNWLEMKEALERKGIKVRNECIYD